MLNAGREEKWLLFSCIFGALKPAFSARAPRVTVTLNLL